MPKISGRTLKRLEHDAQRIGKVLSAFNDSASVFSKTSPRLIDTYEDKWIGVFEGEIAASGESLDQVVREMVRKGIPISETMIRRIDREEKTLIL